MTIRRERKEESRTMDSRLFQHFTKTESLRSFFPGRKDDATLTRNYLDDGELAFEVVRCPDCCQHLKSWDGERHFCLIVQANGTSAAREIDGEHAHGIMCGYVCEVKKQSLRELIEQLKSFPEGSDADEVREWAEDYIQKPNDMPWDPMGDPAGWEKLVQRYRARFDDGICRQKGE